MNSSADSQEAAALPLPQEILDATLKRTPEHLIRPTAAGAGFESLESSAPASAAPDARDLLKQNNPRVIDLRMRRKGMSADNARRAAEWVSGESFSGPSGGLEAMPSPARSALDAPPDDEVTVGLERILGNNELISVRFLDLGSEIARSVGRIVIKSNSGHTVGYGTGFLVSPQILLTNNHVLPTAQVAGRSRVEFNFQEGPQGNLLEAAPFVLAPELFFVTDKALDFTLIAVGHPDDGRAHLADFNWIRLSDEEGEVLIGEYVNIIQHPNGERKQLAMRENQVVAMPQQSFLQYRTDTAPGSSGSPVFNDEWDVVGLHHSGVPHKDSQDRILTRDGTIWQPSMGQHRIDWIANEGIRIVAILNHLRQQTTLNESQRRLRDELLTAEDPPSVRQKRQAPTDHRADPPTSTATPQPATQVQLAGTNVQPGKTTLTIPLQVTVEVLPPLIAQPPSSSDTASSTNSVTNGSAAAPPPADDLASGEDEAISIDQDYLGRQGYDTYFLGRGRRSVALPKLTADMKKRAAVNRDATSNQDRHVLPYHHYSVVMNAQRKLAYYTAVNIDGRQMQEIRREQDRWYFDPRVDREYQAGNAIYARNPLDRGHLVRRMDPTWGATPEVAKRANDDTFHFTNCSPQHKDFNRNKTSWAGLEDYILKNAVAQDLKVTVFSGPIFDDEKDDQYRGIQLPRQYWKVVVFVKDDGKLSATAYLLSQLRLIRDMQLEGFEYGEYRHYQVPVTQIESLTGLGFGKLSGLDPLATQERFGLEGLQANEITSLDEVIF